MHQCVVNTVVVWQRVLGPYWYMYVALFGSRLILQPNSVTYHPINHTPMYFNGQF